MDNQLNSLLEVMDKNLNSWLKISSTWFVSCFGHMCLPNEHKVMLM